MPYDPKSETLEEMRERIDREERERDGDPSPEEIAERAAAIRAAYTNEKGVLIVPACCDNQADGRRQREYRPGIRTVKGPTRTSRPRPE